MDLNPYQYNFLKQFRKIAKDIHRNYVILLVGLFYRTESSLYIGYIFFFATFLVIT